jgi:hypothetical protein
VKFNIHQPVKSLLFRPQKYRDPLQAGFHKDTGFSIYKATMPFFSYYFCGEILTWDLPVRQAYGLIS